MIVTLNPSDMLLAATAGVMRRLGAIRRGRVHRFKHSGAKLGDFQADVVGAMGELVVARHLHVEWHGVGTGFGEAGGPDVGADLQVRTTEAESPHLLLHDDDPDDALFYCVRRIPNTAQFEVYKPVRARDGKRPEFWRTDVRSPCYFVPVEPMNGASHA